MGSSVRFAPLLVLACLVFSNFSFGKIQNGYVQKITDGDTIWFNTRKDFSTETRLKIRMVHIDAPETHLPTTNHGVVGQGHWGDDATEMMEKLIPLETKVQLDNKGTDKYQRTLGVVYFNERDVNLKMVETGWAIPYIICSGSECNRSYFKKENIADYVKACEAAREAGKGIWDPADPLEEMPFEFRLRYQEREPDKFVGDFATKKLYEPEDYKKVDVCQRIFFMTKAEGTRAGYQAAK